MTGKQRGPIPADSNPPPLRSSRSVLPPYRYVPGVHAHPFRHPDGHMYTDGSPPTEKPWDETQPWRNDSTAQYAADLFDHRYYWEAHEAWESMWHQATPQGPSHKVLQSLIQVSAAILQHHMGSPRGPSTLLLRAESRLVEAGIKSHEGIDLEGLIERTRDFFQTGDWPSLNWPGS